MQSEARYVIHNPSFSSLQMSNTCITILSCNLAKVPRKRFDLVIFLGVAMWGLNLISLSLLLFVIVTGENERAAGMLDCVKGSPMNQEQVRSKELGLLIWMDILAPGYQL